MEKSDREYLIAINAMTQLMFVFYSIFFNIFVLSISDDINFVLGINLFSEVLKLVMEFVLAKVLSRKNATILYRLSFLFIFTSIFLAFFVKQNTLWLIWLVSGIFAIAQMLYYIPHEIAVMGKTEKYSVKKFLGISSAISTISAVASPIISGYIIGKWSYSIIFVIIAIFAITAFVLSWFIKDFYTDGDSRMSIRQVNRLCWQDKKIRLGMISYATHKASQDSVVEVLLPVLLFIKIGSEFSVGIYSSIVAAASAIVLIIYTLCIKKKDITMWISSGLHIAMSLVFIFIPNFTLFVIYYIVQSCCKKIYHNGMDETILGGINGTILQDNKKEYHFIFSAIGNIFCMFAYGLAFLIYNTMMNEWSLTLIIVVLTCLQLVSTYLMVKSDNTQHSIAKYGEK